MKSYKMTIAGLERALPLCPLNDKLSIGAFVIFGDPELTTACAQALLDRAPEYDYLISAEAKGEPFLGQIAVGNVVLNRVKSASYPNTVYGVIFDRKYGTQFSPVSYGTIYKAPTAGAIIAAKICLEGYSLSDSALFFVNPRIATNNWIVRTRPYAFTIGNHDFYN